MPLLEKRLTKDWAGRVLNPNRTMISAILFDLMEMGKEIAGEIKIKDYENLDIFLDEHKKGKSPLHLLEGESHMDGSIAQLKNCPMSSLLKSFDERGKLPEHFNEVTEKYKHYYKKKEGVLHPFCIVHQTIRSQIGDHFKIDNKKVQIFQIACTSCTGDRIVYSSEGASRCGMSKEEIDKKVKGNACLYMIKCI
ncbi:MAG: hypothetical protein ACYDFU_09525 [Nitrospirota bacterium]